MATKHTLTFYCPFGLGDVDAQITYTYIPGRPARGPSYASGGEPADPPEIEFVSAEIAGVTLSPALQARLDEWAEDKVCNDGWDDAVANAAGE